MSRSRKKPAQSTEVDRRILKHQRFQKDVDDLAKAWDVDLLTGVAWEGEDDITDPIFKIYVNEPSRALLIASAVDPDDAVSMADKELQRRW